MDIEVVVSNQKLRIQTNLKELVKGTQEFIRFCFVLPDDWDPLLTFAQFQQGGNVYNVYLDDEGRVFLPPEIGAGICRIMLYGTYDVTVATTNFVAIKLDDNGIIDDAWTTEITPTLYQQLVTMVVDLRAFVEEKMTGLDEKIDEVENVLDEKIRNLASDTQEKLDTLESDMQGQIDDLDENKWTYTDKVKTEEQWNASATILKAGEMAIANKTGADGKTTQRVKFGDGVNKFVNLPWGRAKASIWDIVDNKGGCVFSASERSFTTFTDIIKYMNKNALLPFSFVKIKGASLTDLPDGVPQDAGFHCNVYGSGSGSGSELKPTQNTCDVVCVIYALWVTSSGAHHIVAQKRIKIILDEITMDSAWIILYSSDSTIPTHTHLSSQITDIGNNYAAKSHTHGLDAISETDTRKIMSNVEREKLGQVDSKLLGHYNRPEALFMTGNVSHKQPIEKVGSICYLVINMRVENEQQATVTGTLPSGCRPLEQLLAVVRNGAYTNTLILEANGSAQFSEPAQAGDWHGNIVYFSQ